MTAPVSAEPPHSSLGKNQIGMSSGVGCDGGGGKGGGAGGGEDGVGSDGGNPGGTEGGVEGGEQSVKLRTGHSTHSAYAGSLNAANSPRAPVSTLFGDPLHVLDWLCRSAWSDWSTA